MKAIQDLKHTSSVRVIALQSTDNNEIVGKIVANFSDLGVCHTQVFFWGGKFNENKHYELGFPMVKCGGAGYDKLNSNLADIFRPHFESYSEVADLDAGLIEKWFASHGYIATTLL